MGVTPQSQQNGLATASVLRLSPAAFGRLEFARQSGLVGVFYPGETLHPGDSLQLLKTDIEGCEFLQQFANLTFHTSHIVPKIGLDFDYQSMDR